MNDNDARSQQVITNACASIAILNAALNIEHEGVELGEELSNLQAFSEGASFPVVLILYRFETGTYRSLC